MNVWDDIIVYGNTPEEHTQNLRATLNRIREVGLTLNKKKCKFNQESIKFFGHIFSKEGIQADPSKVKAIMKMPAPEGATAVRSFLGMTNYLSRFLPNYADLTAPLENSQSKIRSLNDRKYKKKHSNKLKHIWQAQTREL